MQVRSCPPAVSAVNAYHVFEVLIAEHELELRRYILEFTQDQDLTDEICRDAFVRAFFRLPQLKRKSSFKEWLRMIASRIAHDALLRKSAKKTRTKSEPITALYLEEEPA